MVKYREIIKRIIVGFMQKLFGKKTEQRSVVFYRHSYYHFYYLAQALRERGWDAIVVNIEPISGSNANYYHGEDINLYHDDPKIFYKKMRQFFRYASKRFKLVHFAGDGYLCFSNEYYQDPNPPDIIKWKKRGNKIAYTISGCNSGMSQTSVSQWSKKNNGLSVCDRCVWQENPVVCTDQIAFSWGQKVHQYCDLIFSETSPAIDYMRSHEKIVREPTTMSLDPDFWSPDLEIPEEHLLSKEEGELLIYHAVGNYDSRNTEKKNIKGTPAVFAAIERLKQEGHKVKLIFVTNKPNKVVRFYQAQADIIVDQLNYGRYGATAREGMMLGKPVICYINGFEYDSADQLQSLAECPLVSATEHSVYEELKKLILNPELRQSIAKKSREYALKWHAAAACAERYEAYYDQLFNTSHAR